MTTRLRLPATDAQLAAIMHHAAETHTCVVLGPTQATHAHWLPVAWNPAHVRVAGAREVLA